MITLLFIRFEVVGLHDPNKTDVLFLAFTAIEFAEGVGFHKLVVTTARHSASLVAQNGLALWYK